MIPAQVDHFCLTSCQPLHDQFEKGGVFFLPFAGLAELPSVYDIAIQDQRVTGVVAEKVDGFFNPGVLYAQVNIRQYNGTIVRLQWFGVSQSYICFITVIFPKRYGIVNYLEGDIAIIFDN